MDHGTILDCRQAVMCDATGANEYWQGESNKKLALAPKYYDYFGEPFEGFLSTFTWLWFDMFLT